MSITYTFPADSKVAELAGKTFTGGKFCRADGKWQGEPDAVSFGEQIVGVKTVMLKALISGKPELEAALAAQNAENAAIESRLSVIGWPAYQSAQRKAINARGDYDAASEYGYPQKQAGAMHAADAALDAAALKYPLAAAYARAESYSMASNYAKSGAGARAMMAIEGGADPLTTITAMEADWSAAAKCADDNS